jgi:hypothetical protein
MTLRKDEFRERVAALKHDLGKYVAWTSANLDVKIWRMPVGDVLLDALAGDVLRTRPRGDDYEAAWEVWERLTHDLDRPLAEPELADVEAAVAVLKDAAHSLRARDAKGVAARREQIRAAQHAIRTRLQHLHRRLIEGND